MMESMQQNRFITDCTSGYVGMGIDYDYGKRPYEKVLKDLKMRTSSLKNDRIKEQFTSFYYLLKGLFECWDIQGKVPYFAVKDEGIFLYIEWMFDDSCYGFQLDEDPDRSEWFYLIQKDGTMLRNREKMKDDMYFILSNIMYIVKRNIDAPIS